jgi:hypothetical protein
LPSLAKKRVIDRMIAHPTFLQDFAAAGHAWTKELCQADSDGDGFSNGQELGDPQCTVSGDGAWKQQPKLRLLYVVVEHRVLQAGLTCRSGA